MTEYGLQPSYVRLDYSTPFAPHSHTLCTTQWLLPSITGGMGSYVAWDSSARDAEAMIDDLVNVLKTEIGTDSSYDLATIFNFDTGFNHFQPVAVKALAVAGTGGLGAPRKAISQTLNLRTDGGQPMKVVHLDHSIGAIEFDKVGLLDFDAAALAIIAELTDVTNAWAGRDNTRPNGGVSATFDLNNALRRQYHMV